MKCLPYMCLVIGLFSSVYAQRKIFVCVYIYIYIYIFSDCFKSTITVTAMSMCWIAFISVFH